MAAHIVTAPLVIAKAQDGTDMYLYEGMPVPPLRAGEVARLTEGEFIAALPELEPEPVLPVKTKTSVK